MIIKVQKFLIFGMKEAVSAFFERAQKEGYIEFIGSSKVREFPPFLKNYVNAIKILKQLPVAEKVDESLLNLKDDIACNKIIQITNNIEHLEEIRHSLVEETKTIGPFGNFSLDDVQYIEAEGRRIFQFFVIQSKKKSRKPDDLIYLSTEYDLDYFVAINRERKKYSGYIEVTIDKPIGLLKKRIASIDVQIAKYHEKLKAFNVYLKKLKDGLLDKLNSYNLEIAKNSTKARLEDSLFSIEAWIPENKIPALKELIKDFAVDYEILATSKSDRIPTYMENNQFAAMGEDLVKIYDIPSTEDKDPSSWVLIFFALFFAMIVSDAGYGLIFLGLSFLLKYKMKNPKPEIKRFIRLSFFLSTFCIIWGVFTSSYFGVNISPSSPWQKVSFVNYLSQKKAEYHLLKKDDTYQEWVKKYPAISSAKNGMDFLMIAKNKAGKFEAFQEFSRNILMELSIMIGALHICFAFLRNLAKNLAGLGWVVFIIGAYLYLPSFLQAPTMINFLNILSESMAYKIGFYILFSGVFLAAALAILQHKLHGIKEITAITGVFGDILSYLRIYALALAGAILSETFNEMGSSFNIVIGTVIILMGHLINISMTLMGAVIHSLRLNFLEWYNHCFEGGGKIFNPLKLFK